MMSVKTIHRTNCVNPTMATPTIFPIINWNGFTEETISRISSAPLDVWNLHTQLLSDMNMLKGKLKKFWGVSEEDVKTYLVDKMNEINKLIPLNDGDIKWKNWRY